MTAAGGASVARRSASFCRMRSGRSTRSALWARKSAKHCFSIMQLLQERNSKGRVVALLELVGVPEAEVKARQLPHQLSGGQRQRSLIAAALALDPRILIADEPTTALDVTVQAQVLGLLEQIKVRGKALILISHDLAVVSRIADEVLVMHEGEVVERGSADQVF
ncbi:ATP-binding cassette domain-containing protein [Bradyrhizobium sp. LM6.9]